MGTPTNVYLTVKEAAEILMVHPESLRRLLRDGKFPGRKVGGDWRIPRADVMPDEAPAPEQTDP